MTDPFKIDGPTCISFSGGRTSAYMLWRVLQSNGGLPADAVVCFANTGKEDEATLRFVRDCGERWGVPIVWLEYRPEKSMFEVVNFATASRDGEPFFSMIQKERYLPNPRQRICTSRLKVRTMHRYLRTVMNWSDWTQFIGIRADEQRRVVKLRNKPSPETGDEVTVLPLADAGVTVHDVNAFWDGQPFNLELSTFNGRTLAGNCDLCFLKPAAQVMSLIKEKPERALWWIKVEKFAKETLHDKQHARACLFNMERPSYKALADFVDKQADMFDPNEEAIACFCGD